MPTPTDLVTSLPADFEVFGQAVDSSMADLKGGTSGQILSKNSNTDMDFVWITNDQGDITAVNVTSPITGGGSAGAVTVGIQSASTSQSGAVQLSDSTSTTSSVLAATSTAVKSAFDTAGNTRLSNPVLNSNFNVWQRGTSLSGIASGNNYTADRWIAYASSANATISRQATGDTTNLPNIQYSARIQRNSGSTATGQINFTNPFETVNSIPLAGQTITLSMYLRAGANFSATSNQLVVQLNPGTGTDQNPYSGYSGSLSAVVNSTATLTTTWQRFTFTGTVPVTATEMSVQTIFYPSGTAGANDYYEITGVQINVGSLALPYRPNGQTQQAELAACQRYYWRSTAAEIYSPFGQGYAISTTNGQMYVQMPVQMRVRPTSVDYANLSLGIVGVAGYPVTSLVLNASDAGTQMVTLNCTTAGTLTQFRPYGLNANNTTSSYVGLNAEL